MYKCLAYKKHHPQLFLKEYMLYAVAGIKFAFFFKTTRCLMLACKGYSIVIIPLELATHLSALRDN